MSYIIIVAFLAFLALPTIIYKIRVFRANVANDRADVDSGYTVSLNYVINGINLSIKNHILIFYDVYAICLSFITTLKPTVGLF
jgi:hypothetical protein